AEMWLTDHPGHPDAELLYARVAAIRVLREPGLGGGRCWELLEMAVGALERAATAWDADPTPHVIGLSLDRLRFRDPCAAPGGLSAEAPGPWDRFEQVVARDQDNREAGHHLMAYFLPRHGGREEQAWAIAYWLTSVASRESPVQVLPLYVQAECD